MATATLTGAVGAPDEIPPTSAGRKRWTRDEVVFLETAGFLKGRYELLDGEVIPKMGQNWAHADCVSRIFAYLQGFAGPGRVRTQATMEVRGGDQILNRPEPDAVVLRQPMSRNHTGDDVLLAVEVSDTTHRDDFGPKVGLYARAGVEEYWVLDLTRRVLVAFRRAEDGEWRERAEFAEGDSAAPLCAPGSLIRVADLLPEQGEGPSA